MRRKRWLIRMSEKIGRVIDGVEKREGREKGKKQKRKIIRG